MALQELTVTVTAASGRWWLRPDDRELTFGRSPDCTICLNPEDRSISRLAGEVRFDGATWWLVNSSDTRSLKVNDQAGISNTLAPGARVPVEGELWVRVTGEETTHRIHLFGPPASTRGPKVVSGPPTVLGQDLLQDEDRRGLVALFAGYLRDDDRYDPHPRSYLAAATRLGCTESALRRRVERLRERFADAGVPGMTGPHALENLAEHVLATGLITKVDLRLLEG